MKMIKISKEFYVSSAQIAEVREDYNFNRIVIKTTDDKLHSLSCEYNEILNDKFHDLINEINLAEGNK